FGSSGNLKGLLQTVTDPRGNATAYQNYDAYGNAQRVVDAAGNATTNEYDARSRLMKSSDTIGHETIYGYDKLDRVTTVTRRAWNQPSDISMMSADRAWTLVLFPGGQKQSSTDGLNH